MPIRLLGVAAVLLFFFFAGGDWLFQMDHPICLFSGKSRLGGRVDVWSLTGPSPFSAAFHRLDLFLFGLGGWLFFYRSFEHMGSFRSRGSGTFFLLHSVPGSFFQRQFGVFALCFPWPSVDGRFLFSPYFVFGPTTPKFVGFDFDLKATPTLVLLPSLLLFVFAFVFFRCEGIFWNRGVPESLRPCLFSSFPSVLQMGASWKLDFSPRKCLTRNPF